MAKKRSGPRRGAHRARQALLAAALALPAGAWPTTTTSTFAVTATVLDACVVAATSLVFGNYSSTQLDGSSTVTVTCTNGTGYNIGLDAGTGSGATVGTRKMTSAASQTLSYALYQNAGRTTIWGNTVGSDTLAGTGNGSAQPLTVYGRISGSQYPDAGAYTDTVTVTVTY